MGRCTGTAKSGTLGANWGGAAPVPGDDIILILQGTITFSDMPTGVVAYNSLTISQGTVTFAGVSACTLSIEALQLAQIFLCLVAHHLQ